MHHALHQRTKSKALDIRTLSQQRHRKAVVGALPRKWLEGVIVHSTNVGTVSKYLTWGNI